MKITFSDETKLVVDNCAHDQMSNWLYIYVLTEDFNSLVTIFKSPDMLKEIAVDDGNEIKKFFGYINTQQFFGIARDKKILATVVLKQDEQLLNDN